MIVLAKTHPVWEEWGKTPAASGSALNLPQKLFLLSDIWKVMLAKGTAQEQPSQEPFGALFLQGIVVVLFPANSPS